MKIFKSYFKLPFFIFFGSLIFILLLLNLFSPKTADGIHFQMYSSDDMLQALPIGQLKKTPLQSLFYLHKQPPGLDIVRIIAGSFTEDKGNYKNLVANIDKVLYVIWAIFYSTIALLIFKILHKLTSLAFSLVFTLVWILNPATIFYATFLDGTLLSSLLVICLFYFLIIFRENKNSLISIALTGVALFYSRTVFQWYFFVILFISIYLLRASKKQLLQFLIIIIVLACPLLIKQKTLFNTFNTSTFAGYHLNGLIWNYPSEQEISSVRNSIEFNYPISADKFSGADVYNSQKNYEDNLVYTQIFLKQIKLKPAESLANVYKSFLMNFNNFWEISYSYPNIIVDNLSWTAVYRVIFTKYVYMVMVALTLLYWLITKNRSNNLYESVGLLLPFLYTFLVINLGNRYEWSETSRLKFILEPVFYIAIFTLIFRLTKMGSWSMGYKLLEKIKTVKVIYNNIDVSKRRSYKS